MYNPVRFAGSIYDAYPRLYFMRARYYGPELARFISEDPIGIGGGMNLYAYAGNNPVNFRDPFGLEPCTKRDKATGTAYQPDGTACELPGVVATGRKGGGGGTVYIGGSGRGGSGYRPTRGGGRPPRSRTTPKTPAAAQCLAGLFLSTGGTASGLKEFSHIRGSGSAMQWRGANNQWYRAGWGGNQWTGGRNAVVAAGQRARVAGRAFGAAGIGISLVQSANSVYEGDAWGALGHGVDAGVAAAGTFGGPVLLGASLLYFSASYYNGC